MSGDVWSVTVDDHTWLAEVTRIPPGEGVVDAISINEAVLTVTRISDDEEILRTNVGLAYDALFGPDVDDVNLWTVMVIEAIDHFNAQTSGTPPEDGKEEHDSTE